MDWAEIFCNLWYFDEQLNFMWKITKIIVARAKPLFPKYNIKLHDVCSTSNLMHPSFKGIIHYYYMYIYYN